MIQGMTETSAASGAAAWSIVLAYYNEAEFLPDTLRSLAAQTMRGFHLILVNNASSDNSEDLARAVMAAVPDIRTSFLTQTEPGQIHALRMGVDAVQSELVCIMDADTYYPPHYLAEADAAFRKGGSRLVGVMATDIYAAADTRAGLLKRLHVGAVSRILGKQAHTGGYAYAFRTETLRKAGSYDAERWPYVLSDHEMVHRVLKFGRTTYPFGHWCMPSTRRPDEPATRWTLTERLAYHFTPYALKDWLFYSYLARRFHARKMGHTNYRIRNWVKPS
jgi:glycosyltransferase involved in cell wall biosynthesis